MSLDRKLGTMLDGAPLKELIRAGNGDNNDLARDPKIGALNI